MNKILYWFLIPALFLAAGCRDDFDPQVPENTDGTAGVDFTITYEAENDCDLDSRAIDYSGGTAGDVIKNLETFSLLIYHADGTLYKRYDIDAKNQTSTSPEIYSIVNSLDDNRLPEEKVPGSALSDDYTGKLSFRLEIPSGNYFVYGVANYALGAESTYDTRDKLKSIRVNWNNADNAVASNSQMFGIFSLHPDRYATDGVTLRFNAGEMQAHCWLRRLASKLTVSFDGSQLYDDVQVFIEDIQIHNVPRTCTLGNENTPGVDDNGQPMAPGARYSNSVHALHQNGQKIVVQQLPADVSSLLPSDALHVCNTMHRYLGKGDEQMSPEAIHANASRSLFFFENCQGEGKSKKQSQDGVNIDYPNWTTGNDETGWQDNKSYGTYVEVSGHYRCSTGNGHVGAGPIKYRFMLGRDADTDYNAERNTHYKLTLKLKGYANDYDWHIDYKEDPGIHVTNPIFVSYLYNKQLISTVKIIGEVTGEVKAHIITPQDPEYDSTEDTYWAPWGDDSYDFPDPRNATDPEAPWHTYYYQGNVNKLGPARGFLQLEQSHVMRVTPPVYDGVSSIAYSATDPQGYIETEWGSKGDRTYQVPPASEKYTHPYPDAVKGDYSVDVIDNGEGRQPVRVYHIPLFTRPKEIITSSGFTGNNPFYAYARKERVKITATVNGTEMSKIIDCIQVRRVLNPKAILRHGGSDEPFHVKLAVLPNGTLGENFRVLTSHGAWSAEIVAGSDNIASLNSTTAGSRPGAVLQENVNRIQGAAESQIDFVVNFNGTKGFAAIKVRYHNYTCEHDIFLCNGWEDDVNVNGSTYWSTRNVDHFESGKPVLVDNPLDEGSLFRRETYNAITSKNTLDFPRPEGTVIRSNASLSGWNPKATYTVIDAPGRFTTINNAGNASSATWGGLLPGRKIRTDAAGNNVTYTVNNVANNSYLSVPEVQISNHPTWTSRFEIEYAKGKTVYDHDPIRKVTWWMVNGSQRHNYQIADITDFYNLVPLRAEELDFPVKNAYGVVYCDGTTETQLTQTNAFGYNKYDPETQGRGMRGIVSYNVNNFRFVFFPLGSSGHGVRKNASGWRNNDPAGTLRYASRSNCFGFYSADEKTLANLPLFYDLYRRPGAIYWTRTRWHDSYINKTGDNDADFKVAGATAINIMRSAAFDMNFFTYGFEGFQNNANSDVEGRNSHACFIRTVRYQQ